MTFETKVPTLPFSMQQSPFHVESRSQIRGGLEL